MKKLFLGLFFTLSLCFTAYGQTNRAYELMQEVKCPQCQGQSVYDSQTSMAHMLRVFIHEKVQQGFSNTAIKKQLQDLYGDNILFDPPYQSSTWFLWMAPFLFLLLALVGLSIKVIFRSKP